MAQRTGKEETEFKVHDSLTLCANNCGVTGSPATKNMCQKCFNAITATSSSPASTSAVVSSADLANISKIPIISAPVRSLHRSARLAIRIKEIGGETASEEKKVVNRCSCCRKKVGLTGFRCRCGEMFCGEHRYSDRHDCSYDYKTVGREAIARENPVVKAAKIVKV